MTESTSAFPSSLANWNGRIMPLEEVTVSVLDRGFLFGDAVYEVVRVYHGAPFEFDAHLERLHKNLQKLRIPANILTLKSRAVETLFASGFSEAVIYFHITRGVAKRTHYFPPADTVPNVLISVNQFTDPYQTQRSEGVRVLLTPDIRWKRCDIKSTNLLANVLGAEEAHSSDCHEAIFVNERDELTEGTHTSLFAVQNGKILTTPLGQHILPGITRRLVMKLCSKLDIEVQEAALLRQKLGGYDEMFLTGTSSEVIPVIRVNEQTIGTGSPGPIVQKLQEAYREEITAVCRR